MYSSSVQFSEQAFKLLSSISKSFFQNKFKSFIRFLSVLPFLANAEGFKFKIKNTTKNVVTGFYKRSKKNVNLKGRSLIKLAPGEEKIKEVSIGEQDTLSFYGEKAEDER